MQNDTGNEIRSKSKPEVEFQYGAVRFRNRKSLYMDRCISSKFGMRIDFDLKRVLSQKKPEIHLQLHGRHLENRHDIALPPWVVRLG